MVKSSICLELSQNCCYQLLLLLLALLHCWTSDCIFILSFDLPCKTSTMLTSAAQKRTIGMFTCKLCHFCLYLSYAGGDSGGAGGGKAGGSKCPRVYVKLSFFNFPPRLLPASPANTAHIKRKWKFCKCFLLYFFAVTHMPAVVHCEKIREFQ